MIYWIALGWKKPDNEFTFFCHTCSFENKSNFFIQYEIPSNLLEKYKEHYCDASPTDVIIFDRRLVHTSNQNISDKYSVAVVARVWDPTDDLTLTGSITALPYGGNIGRSNLIVDPLD